MNGIKNIWQLSRSERLSFEFAETDDLDAWVSGCVESYLICRQRNHGHVTPDMGLDLSFQAVHDHIYAESGSCSWCRRRVQAKIREWLRRRESSAQKHYQGQPFLVGLS